MVLTLVVNIDDAELWHAFHFLGADRMASVDKIFIRSAAVWAARGACSVIANFDIVLTLVVDRRRGRS